MSFWAFVALGVGASALGAVLDEEAHVPQLHECGVVAEVLEVGAFGLDHRTRGHADVLEGPVIVVAGDMQGLAVVRLRILLDDRVHLGVHPEGVLLIRGVPMSLVDTLQQVSCVEIRSNTLGVCVFVERLERSDLLELRARCACQTRCPAEPLSRERT